MNICPNYREGRTCGADEEKVSNEEIRNYCTVSKYESCPRFKANSH